MASVRARTAASPAKSGDFTIKRIARQSLQHILRRAADEDALQAAARDCAHRHDVGPHLADGTRQDRGRPAHLQVHVARCNPIFGDEVLQLRALLLRFPRQLFRRDGNRQRRTAGSCRCHDRHRQVDVQQMQLAAQFSGQECRVVDDVIVQQRRLVVDMPRIDGSAYFGALAQAPGFVSSSGTGHARISSQSVLVRNVRCANE